MTFLPCLTRSLGGLSLHKANWEDLYNSRVLDNVLETTDDLFSTFWSRNSPAELG